MSNKGIGKGLAALLGNMKEEETIAEKSESAVSREIMNVDISLIDTNPYQPRKVFDKAALEELAASIKTFGIIQPLIVLRSGNRYVIIAGERRFRAARLAGLTSVPCVVRELTPREMREIALIENLQREDLNPVEAAEGIAELIKSCDLTQEEAAERIGMSRPVVTNLLRLLSLDKEVLELVRAGRLSGSHARCLVVVTDPEVQVYYANKACDNKMSVRDLEQQIQLYLGRKQRYETNLQHKGHDPWRRRKRTNPHQLLFQRRFTTHLRLNRQFKTLIFKIKYGNHQNNLAENYIDREVRFVERRQRFRQRFMDGIK